jgi:serine/threonine protein kinase
MDNYQSLRIGSILNSKYKIVKLLGSGGFGITYLVQHLEIDNKIFVVKEFFLNGVCVRVHGTTVQTDAPQQNKFEIYKSKFVNEARTIAKLEGNTNIVEVSDFFYENNTAYMVMPYIQGHDLEVYTRQQPQNRLSEREALDYIKQSAIGLQASHAQNILHRDIKPSNLMRRSNGQIAIIDFGAAREYINIDRSQAMSVIYTLGYAPFEQYSSIAKRGAYSDIYALGATFYRLVTGQVPSDAPANLTIPLKPPQALNPLVSDPVNQIILKMMANSIEARYQNMAELLDALQEVSPEDPFSLTNQKPSAILQDTDLDFTNQNPLTISEKEIAIYKQFEALTQKEVPVESQISDSEARNQRFLLKQKAKLAGLEKSQKIGQLLAVIFFVLFSTYLYIEFSKTAKPSDPFAFSFFLALLASFTASSILYQVLWRLLFKLKYEDS